LSLKNQRRIAASILKVGENRVWIDPQRIGEVEAAITREDMKKLIHEKAIVPHRNKGVSRGRARILHEKKRKGLRKGFGSRTGSFGARVPRKEMWMRKIRALRNRLSELEENHSITERVYRRLYVMASSGSFESVSDLERFIDAHDLRRRH